MPCTPSAARLTCGAAAGAATSVWEPCHGAGTAQDEMQVGGIGRGVVARRADAGLRAFALRRPPSAWCWLLLRVIAQEVQQPVRAALHAAAIAGRVPRGYHWF